MSRIWCFFLLSATAALAQSGQPDPAFDDIPFDAWLKGGDQAHIRWSLRAPQVFLTGYQRLAANFLAIVNGDELVKRDEPGRMVFFLEVRDHDNRTYRSHRVLSLRNSTNPADLADLKLIERACIVPGEYEVAAAIYDAKSKEHNLQRIKLRVPEIDHDPLPDAWRGLPSVELSRSCDPQHASWLHLPLETKKRVRIEVVVNRSVNRNKVAGNVMTQIGALRTRLEVISEMQARNGSMYVTVLDVDRRKVSFTGQVEGKAISEQMLSALSGSDPYRADIHTLDDYKENAQFFISEIRKRLESADSAEAERVLIVLSAPLRFPKGADLRPIQATPQPGTHVFYIRCHSPLLEPPSKGGPEYPSLDGSLPGDLGSAPWVLNGYRYPANNPDSLEQTLKPLNPRLFDINNKPAQFRRALGVIMGEISQDK